MEEDPLAGIANLFDVSVVFIVGLMITLFSVYRIGDLVDQKSEVTMVKTNAQGEREIIVKKGTKITAYKVSGKTAAGDGERLGTAYRLADGQIIYVPEADSETPRSGCGLGLALALVAAAPVAAQNRRPPTADRGASRSRRLSLLRRQPARHAQGLQGAAAGAARPQAQGRR